MAGRPLRHPDIEQVSVADILHALSDPVRLGIVCELMSTEAGQSCVETIGRVGRVLPRSTCSQHYQILREAGLIRCERKGVELSSRLRLAEVEGRFPGLLDSIMRAYEREKAGRAEPPVPREGTGPGSTTGRATRKSHPNLTTSE